jgi:hypothetical protein
MLQQRSQSGVILVTSVFFWIWTYFQAQHSQLQRLLIQGPLVTRRQKLLRLLNNPSETTGSIQMHNTAVIARL